MFILKVMLKRMIHLGNIQGDAGHEWVNRGPMR